MHKLRLSKLASEGTKGDGELKQAGPGTLDKPVAYKDGEQNRILDALKRMQRKAVFEGPIKGFQVVDRAR